MERDRGGRPRYPGIITPAEQRVLEELRKGGTNAEIAVRLGIGPETVKTHIANMLLKLDLEDRRQLAAWREEDAPRYGWLLALLLRPLVAAGVVAGAALVIVVVLGVLALVWGDHDPPYIEGVGEITGPVAVFVVTDFVAKEPAEGSQDSSTRTEARHYIAALDLGTGREWVVMDIETEEGPDIFEFREYLALAGDGLLIWTDKAIHTVTLDGRRHFVPFRPDAAIVDLIVSPDSSKVAVALDAPAPFAADSIVVLNLRSGSEVLRIAADAPRIAAWSPRIQALGALQLQRWSPDGTSLWARFHLSASRSLHVILTLDGVLHVLGEEIGEAITFSADLSHAIAHSGRRNQRGYDSLTVTELSTGRVVSTLEAEEGQILQHVAGPFAGRYVYATLALEVLDEALSRPPDSVGPISALLVNLSALEEGIAIHDVDLATGDVALLSEGDEVGVELFLEVEKEAANLGNVGHCFEDFAAYESCKAGVEKLSESDGAGGIRRFIGYIWPDLE